MAAVMNGPRSGGATRGDGRRSFRWDLLVKLGGSLGSGRALAPLLTTLATLARRHRILVIPGGGVFADLVRREKARRRLPAATAHRMALLAMDQYGLLLAAVCPDARPVANLEAATGVARRGRLPILLASGLIGAERGLERTFRLTSDSIAAHLAGVTRARRLVLLKSVPRPPVRIADRVRARSLARRGVVDPLFPALLPASAESWIVNGRAPREVERFLNERLLDRIRQSGSAAQMGSAPVAAVEPTGSAAPSARRKARSRSGSSRPWRPPVHRAPRAPMKSGPRATTAET
jgi:5-(aminomethyl)-3-furanmethanol phosphate kinase